MRVSPRKRIRTYFFLLACLVESFPIGPERKHKVDFFALFIRLGLFLQTTQSVSLMDTKAIGKANNTYLLLFKSTATEQVACSKHRVSRRITRYNLTFLSFHSFQTQFSFKCWKQCTWFDKSSLRNRKRAFHSCPCQRAGLGGSKQQRQQYFDKLEPLPWR